MNDRVRISVAMDGPCVRRALVVDGEEVAEVAASDICDMIVQVTTPIRYGKGAECGIKFGGRWVPMSYYEALAFGGQAFQSLGW